MIQLFATLPSACGFAVASQISTWQPRPGHLKKWKSRLRHMFQGSFMIIHFSELGFDVMDAGYGHFSLSGAI
jgi:hypothetical protein